MRENILSVIMILFFVISSVHAASVKITPGADGKERVVLENEIVRLEIDPNRGARVDKFQFKPWLGIEIMQDKNMHGLFIDHFWQEGWPGQFWAAGYNYEIISNGPDEAAVKFNRLSGGLVQVSGIRLEKTITLKENDRRVYATIRLTNTASESKFIGYWMQNICWLGGDKEGDEYFRPDKLGINRTSSDDTDPADAGFVREPQAGWVAAIDRKSRSGLVFYMDYNHIWFLYNCTGASTIEWQDEAVVLPAGKSWQTEVSVLPVMKMDSVAYASDKLLLAASIKEDKSAGRIEVTETFQAVNVPLKNLTVRTGLEALLTNQKQAGSAQSVSNLGFDPQTITASLPYDPVKREPAVIRLAFEGETVGGERFSENAELWHCGSLTANTNPMVGGPFYTIKSAPKVKTAIKPDRIARIIKDAPQVLFIKGFLSSDFRLEAALQKMESSVNIKRSYVYNGGIIGGWQVDFFPYDYGVLMSYDLVILGDVNAACLGEAALEMLKDYCKHGGSLLILGGPFAYGAGGYKESILAEMLPVEIAGPFDLRRAKNGATDVLRPEYIHSVRAKTGAKVLFSCGGVPVITLGKYDRGRICCISAATMGESNFCDTPAWRDVLARILKQLGVFR